MIEACNGYPIPVPAVGDKLQIKPFFGLDNLNHPIPCTVISVNVPHGHYTVQFDGLGFREAHRFL